jgi:hypothetical protein
MLSPAIEDSARFRDVLAEEAQLAVKFASES